MFIIVTNLKNGSKIRIITNNIVAWYIDDSENLVNGCLVRNITTIRTMGNLEIVVKETPEQIDELIRKAQEPEIIYSCKDFEVI